MNRLEKLEEEVRRLYKEQNPARDDWADWLYENHVLIVAKHAKELAERFGVDAELSQAAALLHDIADSVMSRFHEDHASDSLRMARALLEKTGYTEAERAIIVDDACKLHSCSPGEPLPQTDVGNILATADAIVDIVDSSFFDFAHERYELEGRLETFKPWFNKKMEKCFNVKIRFPEIREENQQNYDNLIKKFNQPS